MKQTIFITGGTGFAGSHLVEALSKAGYSEIHIAGLNGHTHFLPAEHVHRVDLTVASDVAAVIEKLKPTQIYHLAASAAVQQSFHNAQQILDQNTHIQLNVLEAVRHHVPNARVLIVGSAMEYDMFHGFMKDQHVARIREDHPLGPVSPYAVSKVMQDLLGLSYAYSYKVDVVRARPFNHIGERQTADFALPSFARQIVAVERGQASEVHVGNLTAVRDFTDVKDVARAYILLMEKGISPEVYNIGSGVGHSMQEILDMLCALSKTKITVVTDEQKVRPLDVPAVIADSSKIKQLGWQPTIPLEQTLQRILEEWRQK